VQAGLQAISCPNKRKEGCQELLALLKDPEEFFGTLVTDDEFWFHYQTSEMKRQSMQWKHDDNPCPKMFWTAPVLESR
jgi:hypothetical protein